MSKFKFNNVAAVAISFSLFLVLTACGGGGGGGGSSTTAPTPTPTNIPFQAFPTGFFTQGNTQTFQLSGSDNQGGTYTATFTDTTQAQTTYASQPAIPVQGVVAITNTKTNASFTVTGVDYYTTDINNLMYLGFTDSTSAVFTPVSMSIIPKTAMIGQQGDIGTYSGSGTAAGETDTYTWQLTNANNGLANLIIFDTEMSGSTFVSSTKISYTIDQQGIRHSVTIVITDSSGLILTLSGS